MTIAEARAEKVVQGAGSDVAHALFWGLLAAALVIVGIVAGSRGLKDFDVALVPYAGATVFAAFGVGYRYTMWLPPAADPPVLVPRAASSSSRPRGWA